MSQQSLQTYLKLCTEYYDLNKTLTSSELSFYLDYAKNTNGPVLEPMCGTGRFLIPMLQTGIDIEGFDASKYMLDALAKKYALVSTLSAPVIQKFVHDFKSYKHYGFIFIPFGSWGLIINPEESKKSLEIMYKHLAPGGTLVLEIETVTSAPTSLNVWHRSSHTRPDGSWLVLNTLPSYDQKIQLFTCLCRYESFVNGALDVIETEDFKQYLYRFDEFDALLKETGFTQIKKYQDYKKNKAQDNAPLVIYECVKN